MDEQALSLVAGSACNSSSGGTGSRGRSPRPGQASGRADPPRLGAMTDAFWARAHTMVTRLALKADATARRWEDWAACFLGAPVGAPLRKVAGPLCSTR